MPILLIIIFAAVIFLLVADIGRGRGQNSRGRRSGHTTDCQSRSDLTEALMHIASLPYLDEHATVIAAPGRELVIEGCHRFSSYALIFRLGHVSLGRSRLRAESRAAPAWPAASTDASSLGRAGTWLACGAYSQQSAVDPSSAYTISGPRQWNYDSRLDTVQCGTSDDRRNYNLQITLTIKK